MVLRRRIFWMGRAGGPPIRPAVGHGGRTNLLGALGLCLFLAAAAPCHAADRAFSIYGGRLTEDKWVQSLPPGVDFADAHILVAALSETLKSYRGGSVTLEIEGQVARHFGDQDHFEFNVPLALRWHDLFTNGPVAASLAFGLGPSWATQEPAVEEEVNGTTQRFLVHWYLEMALGPPGRGWDVIFRLHHRSKAYGLAAEEGGSNTLAAGMRFSF